MGDPPPFSADAHDGQDPGVPRPRLGSAARARPRLWQAEEITEPQPLVEALRRTPYRNPRRRDGPEEEPEARASLDLALRAGELMLRCGASARDVEASVVAIAATLGLASFEVDITNQSLLVQCLTPGGRPITVIRVARSSSNDFYRLVRVHQLVRDLAAGQLSRREATHRLREIRRAPRFWPRWAISLAYGVVAASVAALLGAGVVTIFLALLSAVAVDQVGRVLSRRGLPAFYLNAIGGGIATVLSLTAFAVARTGAFSMTAADVAYLVAGGIVVLLPGQALASSVEDAITGYPVTGTGRLYGVFLTTAGIILGVAAGLSAALHLRSAFGLTIAVPSTVAIAGVGAPLLARVLGGALGAAASGVSQRTPRRLVLPAGALGALGMLIAWAVSDVLRLGALAGVGVACVGIGYAGRALALRMGAPALVLVIPAVAPQLPGFAIFRGMFELVSDSMSTQATSSTALAGFATLLGAAATGLAIGTGTVLGGILASPLDRQMVRPRRSRRR